MGTAIWVALVVLVVVVVVLLIGGRAFKQQFGKMEVGPFQTRYRDDSEPKHRDDGV